MRTALRSVVSLAAFSLASVVNPGYFSGCVMDEHTALEFGEAEMLDLVEKANVASPFEIAQPGEDYRLELSISQQAGEDADGTVSALFASRAYACGNRTFRQSASACVTTSTVPLQAVYSLFRVTADGEEIEIVSDQELTGELVVSGNRLTNGMINLRGKDLETVLELHSVNGTRIELDRFRSRVDGLSLIL